jgi:hypothetical protein
VAVILGIASFLVALPQREEHGVKVGGASVGIETTSKQKLPPYVGAILIAGGLAMMLAGGKSTR